MMPSGVGWVVLDGSGIDAATLDHDVFDVAGGSADDGDISRHIAAVRGAQAIAAASGQELRSIGVTWTDGAAATAKRVLRSLPDLGFDTVVSVRLTAAITTSANEAQLMLARGAALAVRSNAETVAVPLPHRDPAAVAPMTKQSWSGSPARAAAVLVAGVIALFVVGPELADQPVSRSTEIAPASEPSATSVNVPAVPGPDAAPPVADTIQLVVGRPAPAPPASRAPLPTQDSAPTSADVAQAAPPVAEAAAPDAPVTAVPTVVRGAPGQQTPVLALSTEGPYVPGQIAPQPALAPPAMPPPDPAQIVLGPLLGGLP